MGSGANVRDVTDVKAAVRTLARLSRLLERAAGDVSLPQFRLLTMIDEGGQRASFLAEKLAVAKPTVTALVDGLVERGLVSRSVVEGDRRAIQIALTQAGRKALRAAEAAMAARIEPILERAPDRYAVFEAIAALGAAMSADLADRVGRTGA